jgi:murein DD-endopeptidase MepM/ murein hydrolase activator NlpD
MVNMRKIRIILPIIASFCLVLSLPGSVFGVSSDRLNDEIKQLNQEISSNRELVEKLDKQKKQYTKAIQEKREEAKTLANELSIIDNKVAMAQLQIEDTTAQINEVSLEIRKTSIEIEDKEAGIDKEKKDIANILKLIYRESDASTLEILLLNDSLAEFLNRVKYLEDINREMGDSLDELKKLKADLERDRVELDAKNKDLVDLKTELERNKIALEEERQRKDFVLAETKNSESEYQDLLAASKREQDRAAAEIADLEKTVRQKMASLDKNKIRLNADGLVWPTAGRYVTTYFRDPEYPFRYIFEHPAIDIRSPQGSPIYAADSGYVARVNIKGKAYGYIMIIHGDGLSTVYGHVSKSFVGEDEYVSQGQTIALSGGMPGTTGAGSLTTGPHLHFEVRKDGVPVNPLEYLP